MVVLFGKSGTGKTSIINELCKNKHIRKAVSHTSRLPRAGEIDGVDYHFCAKEEMMNLYQSGELLEIAEYDSNLYGLSKCEAIISDVHIMEPSGIKNLLKRNDIEIFPVRIECDESVRIDRLKNRYGDDEDSLYRRIHSDDELYKNLNLDCPVVFNNSDIESAVDSVYLLL